MILNRKSSNIIISPNQGVCGGAGGRECGVWGGVKDECAFFKAEIWLLKKNDLV